MKRPKEMSQLPHTERLHTAGEPGGVRAEPARLEVSWGNLLLPLRAEFRRWGGRKEKGEEGDGRANRRKETRARRGCGGGRRCRRAGKVNISNT